jgi:hypothetical protein
MAQLVARLHGVQEAVGSNPTSPTRRLRKNKSPHRLCSSGAFSSGDSFEIGWMAPSSVLPRESVFAQEVELRDDEQ